MDKIDKDFGKGSVMMMNERVVANERVENAQEVISTGSIGLDAALGIGGLPRGRVIEIYGPESSGKTTVATHVIAEAKRKVACVPLSMPSMLLTVPMHKSWVLILITS
jgi:recombination protein RecA